MRTQITDDKPEPSPLELEAAGQMRLPIERDVYVPTYNRRNFVHAHVDSEGNDLFPDPMMHGGGEPRF